MNTELQPEQRKNKSLQLPNYIEFPLAGRHSNTVRGYFKSDVKLYDKVELIHESSEGKQTEILVRIGKRTLGKVPKDKIWIVMKIMDKYYHRPFIAIIDWSLLNNRYQYLVVHIGISYSKQ